VRAIKLNAPQVQLTNLQTMYERGTATSVRRRQLDLAVFMSSAVSYFVHGLCRLQRKRARTEPHTGNTTQIGMRIEVLQRSTRMPALSLISQG
jgi:hypothetical protein